MNRIQAALKNNAFVPYTIYLVSLMLFGMWSMMFHLHWLVPIALVAAAAWSQKPGLVVFNMVAAAVMAVYGLAKWQHINYFFALMLALSPLLVLAVLTSALTRRQK
jgi:hypothetical protein